MAVVQDGRFTASIEGEGEVVVFIIGMRFNALWKVRSWLPVVVAMPRMLRELDQHPGEGLLSTRYALTWRTIALIQYWRSFDELEAFAKHPDDLHLPAWRKFNRRGGANGDVGVYHETFRVSAGQHESIYVSMPVMGLAAAGSSLAVGGRNRTARGRLGNS